MFKLIKRLIDSEKKPNKPEINI